MERNRKEKGRVLDSVAELFDLPADVVAGLPRLELVGDRQLYLEHHTGLLAYSDTQIDANTAAGVLRVTGERLTLLTMTAEELRIGTQGQGLRRSGPDLSRVRQKPHQNAAEHQTGKRQIARFHTHHQKRLCAKAGKFASFFA